MASVLLPNEQARLHRPLGFRFLLHSFILFARMKVTVIIPAAGLGTRMASVAKVKKPAASKQFAELKGKPILVRTLLKFAKHPQITAIYVALRKEEIAPFRARQNQEAPEITAKKPVLLEGGEHRASALFRLRTNLSGRKLG